MMSLHNDTDTGELYLVSTFQMDVVLYKFHVRLQQKEVVTIFKSTKKDLQPTNHVRLIES